MPYVNVFIDSDDILGDLSDKELRDELARRAKRNGGSPFDADYMIPPGAARLS